MKRYTEDENEVTFLMRFLDYNIFFQKNNCYFAMSYNLFVL